MVLHLAIEQCTRFGEPIEIVGSEYAGLGGNVVATYTSGYEVLIGGYQLPVAVEDLALDLLVAASEALTYLETLRNQSDDAELHRLLARLWLTLPHVSYL